MERKSPRPKVYVNIRKFWLAMIINGYDFERLCKKIKYMKSYIGRVVGGRLPVSLPLQRKLKKSLRVRKFSDLFRVYADEDIMEGE